MKRIFLIALMLVAFLTALSRLLAQAPADEAQTPASATPRQVPASSANPFPEDTSTVPLMPSKSAPALPEGTYNGAESAAIPLPGEDLDPVSSPDDPAPTATSGQDADSSSSLQCMEKLLPPPDTDHPAKKKKLFVKQPTQQEAASKDIEIGDYYIQTKNWKGALSRFESALVLDPENPEVYWGLAEADRHLGNFADARANYEKVAEYDPDSRHGKEAQKALKEPEIANGKNAIQAAPPDMATQK